MKKYMHSMNQSFRNAMRFIQKHKYMCMWIILVLLFLLILTNTRVIEGLTASNEIGEYEYLAPIPPGNTISDEIIKQYVTAYNNKVCPNGATATNCMLYLNMEDANLKGIIEKNVLEKELVYYINNGKFPYSSSLIKIFRSFPPPPGTASMTPEEIQQRIDKDIEQTQQKFTSRQFMSFIYRSPYVDKESLAYKIFMGEALPPAPTPVPPPPNQRTAMPPSTPIQGKPPVSPPVSNSEWVASMKANCQQIANTCKKIM